MAEGKEKRPAFKIDDPVLFEKTREYILKIYHSDIQTHAGYLIAIVIGVLALISRWDVFFNNSLTKIIFFIILAVISAFAAYAFKRMFYWIAHSNVIIGANTESIESWFDEALESKPLLKDRKSNPYTLMFQVATFYHLCKLKSEGKATRQVDFALFDGTYFSAIVALAIALFFDLLVYIFIVLKN